MAGTAADSLRTKTTATIECPKSMVGRVIGKNGETIKALQTYTQSLIQVNQANNPCQITISGSPQSLSLAVSMVADIVKGTFKGFALLRQVATTGSTRIPAPVIQAPPQPQPQALPVYAPGYGLIPPSQLYGGEDRVAISGGQANALPAGLSWSADLQAGQRAYGASALLGSSAPLSIPVYAQLGRGQYGGMAQELTGIMQPADAILYQGASGGRNASLSGSDVTQMGNGVGLMQASRGQMNQLARGAGWLPQGSGNPASFSNMAANFGMGELVDSGGSLPATSPAGNLVMDANGQVFYINAANMLN